MHKIQLGYTAPKSMETRIRSSVGIEPAGTTRNGIPRY
jgi:hypothetical protein